MIILKNLTFQYKKGKPILENLSTQLLPGHIYGLLGLNGTGKSTFLKTISGLLFPQSGSISVASHTPSQRKLSFLSDLYLVTDEVNFPNWKISSYLDIYSPLYPNFDHAYFQDMLSQFQVDETQQLHALSYGQRKKVNIAFALASNVRLLLMDEPTNGLDIPSKTQFRKVMAKHVTEDRIIIIATHQTRDIHSLIDHLLILQSNHLILDASIYQILQSVQFTTGTVADALYTETNINGASNILLNTAQQDSPLDIELLFNAIHQNPYILQHLNPAYHATH